ncbi:MAG: RecX family transcriptional regulator [Bdellovibrionales bacterium]|nr:RecX family transcriptional regulator [Bdellovibrionales bacterium]
MQKKKKKYAIKLLKKKLWTQAELQKRLEIKFGPSDEILKIIDKFSREGLLNDQDYARAYITSKNNISPTGDYKKKLFLLKKGINVDVVDSAIQNFSIGDEETAKILIDKKIRNYQRNAKKLDHRDIFAKLINHLSYHCIKTETAYKILEEMRDNLLSKESSDNVSVE